MRHERSAFRLSPEGRTILGELAARHGISRTATIELLIREAKGKRMVTIQASDVEIPDVRERTWVADFLSGRDWEPTCGALLVLTGRVLEGPLTEVVERGGYHDYRCDSFVLRITQDLRGGGRHADVRVCNHKDASPPHWLTEMQPGMKVQVEVMEPGPWECFGPDGLLRPGLEVHAYNVRLFPETGEPQP